MTLFAFSPTAWHAEHFRNDRAPASTSCATAAPVNATSAAAPTTKPLMDILPVRGAVDMAGAAMRHEQCRADDRGAGDALRQAAVGGKFIVTCRYYGSEASRNG